MAKIILDIKEDLPVVLLLSCFVGHPVIELSSYNVCVHCTLYINLPCRSHI